MKSNLPLQEIILKGIKMLNGKGKLKVGIETLLVSIAYPKLNSMGIRLKRVIKKPEIKLYDYLSKNLSSNRAHSAYNAYIRRLVSFERGLRCAKKQTLKKLRNS